MLLRRVAILVGLLFLTAMLTSSLAGRENVGTTTVARGPVPPMPAGAQVEGSLPADRVVRAVVGDIVSISVRPKVADDAVIDELGVRAEASPQVPGILEFIPTEPGRFPVLLDASGERMGTVVVAGAKKAARRGR
jgi:hypothetical protein